jgi:hypothetical protein
MWQYRQAARDFAEAVIRSVELIVHSEAKDAVGEMAVGGDLPPGHAKTSASASALTLEVTPVASSVPRSM